MHEKNWCSYHDQRIHECIDKRECVPAIEDTCNTLVYIDQIRKKLSPSRMKKLEDRINAIISEELSRPGSIGKERE